MSKLRPNLLMTSIMFVAFAMVAHGDDADREWEVPEDRSEKIRWGFEELNIETMDLLDDFYHDDVHFVDPVVDVHGLEDLRKHYEHQYEKALDIGFKFVDEHITGDTHTVEWTMTLRTKRLNKGQEFTVPGVSVITFKDDKVIYHRDYFDLGDMLYERIVIMRFFVKKIKKRLHFNPDAGEDTE